MEEKFICNDEKYTLKKQTISLPVAIQGLPDKLEIGGYTLLRRSSFHVSLVCIGKIIEKEGIQIPEFENAIINDFCEFVSQNDISLIRYRDEFRFVVQNERRSVVAMCEVTNLEKFFDLLNKKYKLHLKVPPTHVTLYTLQLNLGIFLTDLSDIQKLTKLIPKPFNEIL